MTNISKNDNRLVERSVLILQIEPYQFLSLFDKMQLVISCLK